MGQGQMVLVNEVTSGCLPVSSESPQGFILGPVFFNVFKNNLGEGPKNFWNTFMDDMKLGGAVDSIEGGEAFQRE